MCTNYLKYCRGDVFSNEHWVEFLNILNISKEISTFEQLKFEDLLKAQENIFKNFEELKNLQSRAQGEVVIREAIHNIELWGGTVNFF